MGILSRVADIQALTGSYSPDQGRDWWQSGSVLMEPEGSSNLTWASL